MREGGWDSQVRQTVLAEDQVARRAAWLTSAARQVSGLAVEREALSSLSLPFASVEQAELFHRALLAESMPARLDGSRVELRIKAWYSPADLSSLALAVAKVAHYLTPDA